MPEPHIEDIVTAINAEHSQIRLDELIETREKDVFSLSRYHDLPAVLGLSMTEYEDNEENIYLLDQEGKELSFVMHGFVAGSMLPLRLNDMVKRGRFKPAYVKQSITVMGGKSLHFMKYINAACSIYNFMASSRSVDDFKEYRLPIFGGFIAIGASTRFLTRSKFGQSDSPKVEIPRNIDPTRAVQEAAERQGYCFTEDNYVVFKGLSKKSNDTLEISDVAPSYINVGQLVEIRISFRGYKAGHKRVFKTKLNSIVVLNTSTSRDIFALTSGREIGLKTSDMDHRAIVRGLPKKRKYTEDISTELGAVSFLGKSRVIGGCEGTAQPPVNFIASSDSEEFDDVDSFMHLSTS